MDVDNADLLARDTLSLLWSDNCTQGGVILQVNAQKKEYDAKVTALKQGAAQKEADQARMWQARINVVERIKHSAQAGTTSS